MVNDARQQFLWSRGAIDAATGYYSDAWAAFRRQEAFKPYKFLTITARDFPPYAEAYNDMRERLSDIDKRRYDANVALKEALTELENRNG